MKMRVMKKNSILIRIRKRELLLMKVDQIKEIQ